MSAKAIRPAKGYVFFGHGHNVTCKDILAYLHRANLALGQGLHVTEILVRSDGTHAFILIPDEENALCVNLSLRALQSFVPTDIFIDVVVANATNSVRMSLVQAYAWLGWDGRSPNDFVLE